MDAEFSKTLLDVIPPLIRLIRAEIKVAAAESITFPKYRVLANIKRGLATVSEIAEHQGVSQPAMTKMVNALVKDELVQRKKSTKDARQTILSLTTKGSQLHQSVRSGAQKRLTKRFGGMNAKDKTNLLNALLKTKEFIE